MKIDFRAEIKKLMEKRKMNVPELARSVEPPINPQTIYNYLNGDTEMTSGNLERILNKLKS